MVAAAGHRTMRTLLLLLAAVAAIAVIAVIAARGSAPPAAALARHLARPADEDAFYPRLGTTMRNRAWTLYGPGQNEGIALFTALPDAVFGDERTVLPIDLQAVCNLVRDRGFDRRLQAWTGDGGPVPLARVRDMLEAACPTPDDARLVLDLLLGRPGAGAPDFAALLQSGRLPERIRIVPFSGNRGTLQRDVGLAPYRPAIRPYRGLMVAFAGPGWPAGWRVGMLRAVGY